MFLASCKSRSFDGASYRPANYPRQSLTLVAQSPIQRALPDRAHLRAVISSATLGLFALLSISQAWAAPSPTTTTLTVTNGTTEVTSVAAGTVVTLTATVVSGSTPVNPGQVKFCVATAAHCEDSALLATAQLTTAGKATFKFRPGIGSHSYQAVFVGTISDAKSTSATSSLTVPGPYPTVTALASSGTIGDYTLAATVVGLGNRILSPTGAVSFIDTTNGNASLGTAELGTATEAEALTTASTSAVNTFPYSVAVGDFNRDGIPDLAVTSDRDSTVTILLGNGDGTFKAAASPSTGNSPVSIATGDFNGDGISDLVTANQIDGTVTVLLGKGDGTFTTKSTPGLGACPAAVVIGDFNGDGIQDLATANSSASPCASLSGAAGTVTILLGKGDGTFTTKSLSGVGVQPSHIATGDFNGDGVPDLAVTNADDTVTILLGNGDGTFTTRSTPIVGGYSPSSIAVGDFNGDGVPDLAFGTNANDTTVMILLGKGDGTFTTGPPASVGSDSPASVVTSDFNGDGILDLAVGTFSDDTLLVLLGNGDGTFTTESSSRPVTFSNSIPNSIAVGDFNGDGMPDLAVTNCGSTCTGTLGTADTVTVLLYQFTETATATLNQVSVPNTGTEPHKIAAGYPGNANYNSSISSTVPLLAAKINTSLTLRSSTSTSTAGNPITLTATLSPYSLAGFTTSGETVAFYDGGTSIGSGTLSAGLATLTISTLTAGTHRLTASYSGDTNFTGSNSGSVVQTISKAATELVLSSNPNPSYQAYPVTLLATLNPYSLGSATTDGETVTFYNGKASIGTGTLSSGAATLVIASLPVGTDTLKASYGGDTNFTSTTSNSITQSVTAQLTNIPNFVVTVTTDTTSGVASNCTAASSPKCSLRDALAAADAAGAGKVTFDHTVFAAPQTIVLGNAGGLNIPPNTTIAGATKGSGASLTNLVTVSGGGPVFTVNQLATNTAISGLTITGGLAPIEGGGILNDGVLTVSDSTISGNNAGNIYSYPDGGGVANHGSMTLINSTVTENSTFETNLCNCSVVGGGIYNDGTLTIANSTIVANSAYINFYNYGAFANAYAFGGGISNYGTLTMSDSIVAGNDASGTVSPPGDNIGVGADGGGIDGVVTGGANNVISGNTSDGSENDCDAACGTNGQNGDIIGPGAQLVPLGNYGGPTQTAPPLPGSPGICTGVIADIPAGITTDQRGLPRTTTHGSNPPCVDSGPVQTNYSLSFSIQPPPTIAAHANFAAAVQVSESGRPFAISGIAVALALAAGDNGSLIEGDLSTNPSGIAGASQLQVTAAGSSDKLVATLPLTTSGVTPAAVASAASSAFNVTSSTGVQVTIGASPPAVSFMVDGTSYSAPITLTWTIGSQHTLAAASPQDISGAQYSFASWSDGGAISHTVTASSNTIDYTAIFNSAFLLTTSANPSQGGTVSPASGTYYPAGSAVNVTATRNPGYAFAGWTGNVASVSDANTTITMLGPESVTANFTAIPNYIVRTRLDDAGIAANCMPPAQNCGLRDALAAAAADANGADISFDANVFGANQPASARTITLGSAGTLNVPSNTRILGPTTGSGPTLKTLVTVNGDHQFTVFTIPEGVTNAALSGLTITGGDGSNGEGGGGIQVSMGNVTVINSIITGNTVNDFESGTGGGIYVNGGIVTVMGCVIDGNTASVGGGIESWFGTVIVTDTTVAGNSAIGYAGDGYGGGIDDFAGTVTLTDSTIAGNIGGGLSNGGGPMNGTLVIADSTVSGNSADDTTAAGIIGSNNSVLSVTNSIIAGNTNAAGSSDVNCDGYVPCPSNGVDGNVVGVAPMLAPLANYGGATPTMPPLPGSPALCAGLLADIPAGLTTDQRGQPRTTKYGSTTCVDSGAIETHYSLAFFTQPPATVTANKNFTAAVQLDESGSPFMTSGIAIPLALPVGDKGTLNVSSLSTNANGIASSNSLQVSAAGIGDSLVAMLPITSTPAPAPIGRPIDIEATSHSFNVTATSGFTIQVIEQDPAVESYDGGVIAGFLLQVTSVNGFAGEVTLSCSGGPPASICGELPAMVKVNGTATALGGVWYPKSTAPGTYTITFRGVSGSFSSSTSAKLTVN